jgi:hypothetical protein
MKNFLGGIKKAELKIIDAGKFGNNDELVDCAFDCVRFLESKGFEAEIRFNKKQIEKWDKEQKLEYVTITFRI